MFEISPQLQQFAEQQQLQGITAHTLDAIQHEKPGYSVTKAQQFVEFYRRLNNELLQHPVITCNRYTEWFSRGEMSLSQLQEFVIQFSVFSNLFIVAQLQKTINADSLESMHASKEILVNELGVVFSRPGSNTNSSNTKSSSQDSSRMDSLVEQQGTVEGGIFHFSAAHFEWLLQLAEKLGLTFNDLGKRRHGRDSTLFFCDELSRLYANEDYTLSQASSFAVENWAAAGFWKQLIDGLKTYQQIKGEKLPVFFFTWHDKLEAQHAQHTLDELEDIYFSRDIDEGVFIRAGNEMLDAVAVFWNGLEQQRKSI